MRRFCSLPHKLALAVEVLFVYGRARALLMRHSLPVVIARLRSSGGAGRASAGAATYYRGADLARATRRTLAIMPWDSRCLMQSLVLTGLLARRGIRSELLIAVRPGEATAGGNNGFAAHAWVEYMGRPLLPSFSEVYQTLVRL